MGIVYLKKNEINEQKWNKAISESVFPLTYAYSWYLNSICENWGAIVDEDYSFIMPLPYYTKFNQLHVYMPPFTPQLGIFFSKIQEKTIYSSIMNFIPNNMNSIQLVFNKTNNLHFEQNTSRKSYYSIDLYDNYNIIYKRYSAFLKQTIETNSNKKYIISGLSPNEIIMFLNNINYFKDNKLNDYLRKIISITTLKRLSTVLGIYSERNELIGTAIFILSSYTADLVLVAAENDDPQILALLIDKFIKINAGKIFSLNFECTHSTNAENLYSEFSAIKYYKSELYFKRLPKIFRFLSKKTIQ